MCLNIFKIQIEGVLSEICAIVPMAYHGSFQISMINHGLAWLQPLLDIRVGAR